MKYRKKPVVIEAFQMTEERMESNVDWPEWLHKAWNGEILYRYSSSIYNIRTLEGEMQVDPGDYIIQGVKGELYPCKPDIFEMTYEPVKTT